MAIDVYSPLTTKTVVNHNYGKYAGRLGSKVKYVMPHHAASTASAVSTAQYMARANVSTHYCVDDNDIVCCVGEENGTYSAGNAKANCESVSFEMKNAAGAPDWRISDDTWYNAVRLTADIIKRHGLVSAIYGDTVRLHRDFVATACPGKWFADRIKTFCTDVNLLLAVGGDQISPVRPEPVKPTGKEYAFTISRGWKGHRVEVLQEMLNLEGFNLIVDGEFGHATEDACLAYFGRPDAAFIVK
jgi:N-acetylmuramoyl-L-alanine amidase CwlA